jgi:alkylation response protein AidB-like acyl-CoA dehydrogenase
MNALSGPLSTDLAAIVLPIAVDAALHDREGSVPLATLPRVQEAIGRIEALIAANARIAQALAKALATAADVGQPPSAEESGILKVVMAENAVRAVAHCTLLAGKHAHDRAQPLERHWRDVQCARMHALAPDAAYLGAGRAALGGT